MSCNFTTGGIQFPSSKPLELTFDSTTIVNLPIGDIYNVNDWNSFFMLPQYGRPFSVVEVGGYTIKLYGGSGITIRSYIFFKETWEDKIAPISINDKANCVITLSNEAFSYANPLQSVIFPNVTSIGYSAFEYTSSLLSVSFQKCTSIPAGSFRYSDIGTINNESFPSATTISGGAFEESSIVTINLPNITSIGDGVFYASNSLRTLYLPNCASIGSTTGNNDIFTYITGKPITITIPTIAETDADIVWLKANNTVTVILT